MSLNNVSLEFVNICKTFPGVRALDDVSLVVKKGEVHGIVGENGAGKSTLIKILCGIYIADSGEIIIEGKKANLHNPSAAQSHGIQVMHQEINVLPNMSVAENILLYKLPRKFGFWADDKTLFKLAKKFLMQIGLDHIDPRRKVGEFSLATQQMINLARILSTTPKVIVLDEPTASLTQNEAEQLFESIERFKKLGVSIIYISHYLDEVLKISDRVTVLRNGKQITTVDSKKTSSEELVTAMIGKKLTVKRRFTEEFGDNVLELKNVSSPFIIKRISFNVKHKEIFGLYGLNGAGKTETMRAIFGIDTILEGVVKLFGQDETQSEIPRKMDKGLVYIAEERRRQGLVLGMTVKENASLGNEKKYAKAFLISEKNEIEDIKTYISRMSVMTPSLKTPISSLSGGNQQKVIMSRCLARDAKIILLDEPTVGIDVGAREEIYNLISEIVSTGTTVVIASSDMNEILRMCDRIAIIAHGTIRKILSREEASEEKLLLHAIGE